MGKMSPETRVRWMAARVTHGACRDGKELPEHYIWRTMHARCKNPKTKRFDFYGGRGISVCARWNDYNNFVADMGPRPSKRHSIERADNNGNYEPNNCKWVTQDIQSRNKRNNRLFEYCGVVKTMTDWATELHTSKQLLFYRWIHWGTFVKGQRWVEVQRQL